MDELRQLEALGLVLPTPAYFIGAIVFGIIGWVAFRRGKQQSVPALKWLGIALMLYPYAITELWSLWLVGLALCAGVYAKWGD